MREAFTDYVITEFPYRSDAGDGARGENGRVHTPPLPPWIREASVDGYLTAHALLPDETRVYGTESLYGDWEAPALLLAKDFAPSKVLHERIAAGDPRPYHHEPGLRTNARLESLAAPLLRGQAPTDSGLLYGSALANLLRNDGIWSGALPNRREAMAYGERVLSFTLEHMPRLEAIVCMGREAWEATAACLGRAERWEDVRAREGDLRVDGVQLLVVPHPAARISDANQEQAWRRVIAAVA